MLCEKHTLGKTGTHTNRDRETERGGGGGIHRQYKELKHYMRVLCYQNIDYEQDYISKGVLFFFVLLLLLLLL